MTEPSLSRRVQAATVALESRFGRPRREPTGTVLDGLVATILSQATTSANAQRAFQQYRQSFGSAAAAAAAPLSELERVLTPAGLAPTRARRLRAIFARVADDFGEIDLETLREWPDDAVTAYLTSLPGVGPKTAACVLLFALGRAEFPVDTHVHRIATRLGWVAPGGTPERTYAALREVVPAVDRLSLHLNLVRCGREICRSRLPRCGDCPLADDCPSRRDFEVVTAP